MLAKILTNGFFSAEQRTNVLARLQHKTTQTNLRNSCTKLHLRILCHAGAAIRAPLPCTTTDPRTKIECYLLPSCAQELPRSSDAAWTIREVSSESQNKRWAKAHGRHFCCTSGQDTRKLLITSNAATKGGSSS